jgi:hypothetical protein
MKARLPAANATMSIVTNGAIDAVLAHPSRDAAPCAHTPPAGFRPNSAVPIELTMRDGQKATTVQLYYRHVNQSERFESAPMTAAGNTYRATIPAAYTNSPYPLQYYVEITALTKAWLYPGFDGRLANQPYVVLRRMA